MLPVATVATLLAVGMLLSQGDPSLGMALPRVWLGFLLGSLLCRLRDQHEDFLRAVRRPALIACWSAFVALLFTPEGGLIVAAFAGLMLLHGVPERQPSPARLPVRLLVYLGETSFAVYMGHAFIEDAWLTLSRKLGLIQHGNIVVLALVLVVLIQGFAMLLHHGVEEPARKRLRRVGSRRPAYSAAALRGQEAGASRSAGAAA